MSFVATTNASAQCVEWPPVPSDTGIGEFAVTAWASVDHDDSGPEPEYLYAAGALDLPGTPNYGIVRWDRTSSQHVPMLSPTSVCHDLLVARLPEISPRTCVLACGGFTSDDGLVRKIGAWDGQQLLPIGPSGAGAFEPSNGSARSLALWDADGEGPQRAWLVAGGTFTRWGGTPAHNIAAWNGAAWVALGEGLPSTVIQVAAFDFDGPGPGGPTLLAIAGATSPPFVWDGTQWSSLGLAVATQLLVHDFDGDGPATPSLLAREGRVLRRWESSQWVEVPATWQDGTEDSVVATCVSYDPDGDGPGLPTLVMLGRFSPSSSDPGTTFAVLRGDQWIIPPGNPYDALLHSPSDTYRGLVSAECFDPDGPGPRRGELFLGGYATTFGAPLNTATRYVACWNGDQFTTPEDAIRPAGSRAVIYDFRRFDPDGPGAEEVSLYAAGRFRFAGGQAANGLAAWVRGRWEGLGSTAYPFYTIRRLREHDPDGEGPERAWLVGAQGAWTGGANDVLRWDGDHWAPVGSLPDYDVFDLASFDDDGAGPHPPRLFVVGQSAISNAIMFDGENWVAAGAPRSDPLVALHVHDFDGPGPQAPGLYALALDGLWRWDGAAWTPFAGVSSAINGSLGVTGVRPVMASFDPYGTGVQELVIGADTIVTMNGTFRGAAGFNGSYWHALSLASPGQVISLATYDHDGASETPAKLLAGCVPTGLSDYQTVLLNLGQWTSIGPGPYALLGHSPSFETPAPGELFLGGDFAGGPPWPSGPFARRVTGTPLTIASEPQPWSGAAHATAHFSLHVTGLAPEYRWHRHGTPLRDGPGGASADGGVVSGSMTPALVITEVRCADAGAYTCLVTNACGGVTSAAVSLVVSPCPCDPDVNCDLALDGFDVEAQERAVGGDMVDYCHADPDFNGDAAIDGFDVEAVEMAISGGQCP